MTLPASDGRSLRWEGHRDKRRVELVDIAMTVIAREGPGATVEQIATTAKISRQVLYRQFDDRIDLDSAIAEAVATKVLQHVTAHLDTSKGVESGLRPALNAYLDWVQDNESLYWFTRAREAAPGTSQTVHQVRDSLVASVATTIETQLELAGLSSPVPVRDVFAVGTVGMADAVVSNWLTGQTEITRERLVDSLIALIGAAAISMFPESTIANH